MDSGWEGSGLDDGASSPDMGAPDPAGAGLGGMAVAPEGTEGWTDDYVAPPGGFVEPAFVDPAFVDPAFVDPAFVDPAFVDPAFVDPAFVDPASVDSASVDPGYGGVPTHGVLGDPGQDAQYWHLQEAPNSCAVAAQEFVLEDLTGIPFTESQLADQASANGWYDPAYGTPTDDVGNLLEAHGIPTAREEGDIEQLTELVAQDRPVIVAVDSSEIWEGADETELGDLPFVPGGGADHAVVVTGMDFTDPDNPEVILNDSGHPDGAGMRVSLEDFTAAWEDSGNYMVYPDGTLEAQA